MKTIKSDLILTEDTTFDESIKVNGNIRCENGKWNLKVKGNISAGNIDARNIDARNIDALNIDAVNIDARNIDAWNIVTWNIDAWNIDARNIDAWDIIFCQSIKLKGNTIGKIKAKAVIRKRLDLKQKEFKSD